MRGLELIVVGAGVAGLLGLSSMTTTSGVKADPPGIEWEYHKDAKGWYAKPPAEGSVKGGDGGQVPKPDKDGWFYKTEAGLGKYQGWYIWWCPTEKAPAVQGTGDSKDSKCVDDIPALYATGLWRPDDRPGIPYALLKQHISWIPGWKPGDGPDYDGTWDFVKWWAKGIEDDRWVPDEELAEEIDYRVFEPLGKPELEFAPPNGKVLAQHPVVVWTDYPKEENFSDDVELIEKNEKYVKLLIDLDIPQGNGIVWDGKIEATGEFFWTFEDGGTAEGRGRPFEKGVLPSQNPDHYITNTFHKLGKKKVTLGVRWTGDVYVDGRLEPEKMKPVEIPVSEETLEVLESRPVLGN